MSAPALKKLAISFLRGSVSPFELHFEKGKKLTIIYGENASGKSTICDAFEFMGKGRVGSLENRGLGRTSPYWHSIGKTPADVVVSLETASGTCVARVVKADVVVDPATARPKVEVLRRNQILALIEAEPAKRYDAIRRFVDVSGVEASEAALRGLIRDMERNRETAIARVQENQDALENFWKSAGESSGDVISWAGTQAEQDPSESDAELEALEKLKISYAKFGGYPARLEAVEQAVQAATGVVIAAQEEEGAQSKAILDESRDIVGVLEAARAYLHKHESPAKCPLCESSEKVEGLSQRILQRLESFAGFQAARTKVTAASHSKEHVEQQLMTLRETVTKQVEEFEQTRAGFAWSADIVMPASPAPTEKSDLSDWLAATASLVADWRAAETTRLDKKQFTSALKSALMTYTENVEAQKSLDVLLPRLSKALEIVQEERRTFTDGILAKIAGEVGRIYEGVHPGEGLNMISLELDPARRASLSIGASFCGQAAQPQAYFSDSHLDTLGLCVFLALAAMDGPENTILVLDDVLASIDEPHVERLIEILYAEALKFRHCVITTHYRPWKQKLRWGWLQNGQCQFVEMARWSSDAGMSLIRSMPDVERLRALLAETPPDPQLVCAKAGVILEAALDFLTQLYECRIPRRPNHLYTLGDLLPSIDQKLRQALRVEVLTGKDSGNVAIYEARSLTPILDELIRIAQARNVFGCHFSTLSFDLLDSDALGFGQQVLLLMEILTDEEAGWPRNPKSGSYWQTAGDTRRLHPMKQPT